MNKWAVAQHLMTGISAKENTVKDFHILYHVERVSTTQFGKPKLQPFHSIVHSTTL